jgi:hypothetical protein
MKSLTELLEEMKELADREMQFTPEFNALNDVFHKNIPKQSKSDLKEAMTFLSENNIGTLDSTKLIILLEGWTQQR